MFSKEGMTKEETAFEKECMQVMRGALLKMNQMAKNSSISFASGVVCMIYSQIEALKASVYAAQEAQDAGLVEAELRAVETLEILARILLDPNTPMAQICRATLQKEAARAATPTTPVTPDIRPEA